MKKAFIVIFALGSLAVTGAAAPRGVSLAPSHTEMIVVLGAADQLIGVGDGERGDTLPALPRLGGFPPAWEALAALRPDWVLADVSHRTFDARFRALGLKVIYLPATTAVTVEDVFDLMERVGDVVGKKEAARQWREKARARASVLDARVREKKVLGPRVYFEIWPQPLQAAGPESLIGHLIQRVGAINVVSSGAMPLMSEEAVVRSNPQVIFLTEESSIAHLARRPGWGSVEAIKTMRILNMNSDLFSRAGPRVLEAWDTLDRLLYKEVP